MAGSLDVTLNGATASTAGYGQFDQVIFDSGTWTVGKHWQILVGSTEGDITLGFGRISGQAPACGFKFKERVYLGLSSQFNHSENNDPTLWEQQNPGAGFVRFLTQLGGQDSISAFGAFRGRLVVLGGRTIQIWTTDSDPANFALFQTFENLGTGFPLAVHTIGDADLLFVDPTGVKSLQFRQSAMDLDSTDIGTPIDTLIQAALLGSSSNVCGIVDPTSKRYWVHINGNIYVLSRFRSTNVTAWSTFKPSYQTGTLSRLANATVGPGTTRDFWVSNNPTWSRDSSTKYTLAASTTQDVVFPLKYIWITAVGVDPVGTANVILDDWFCGEVRLANTGPDSYSTTSNQTAFTPEKFIVYNNIIYVRDTNGKVFAYGGSTGATYDNCVPVVELPYLDDKSPGTWKYSQGVDVALAGAWTLLAGTDPVSNVVTPILLIGSGSNPVENSDSSYDIGRLPFESQGTHFKLKAIGSGTSTKVAILSALAYHYNIGEVP